MKRLAFLAFAALALLASSMTPSQAHWHHHWYHHHHHWIHETVAFNDLGPGYVWWDYPYYFYSPYSVVRHVLVHESLEIGPTNVWP